MNETEKKAQRYQPIQPAVLEAMRIYKLRDDAAGFDALCSSISNIRDTITRADVKYIDMGLSNDIKRRVAFYGRVLDPIIPKLFPIPKNPEHTAEAKFGWLESSLERITHKYHPNPHPRVIGDITRMLARDYPVEVFHSKIETWIAENLHKLSFIDWTYLIDALPGTLGWSLFIKYARGHAALYKETQRRIPLRQRLRAAWRVLTTRSPEPALLRHAAPSTPQDPAAHMDWEAQRFLLQHLTTKLMREDEAKSIMRPYLPVTHDGSVLYLRFPDRQLADSFLVHYWTEYPDTRPEFVDVDKLGAWEKRVKLIEQELERVR